MVGATESARSWSVETVWRSAKGPIVPVNTWAGFVAGAVRLVSGGGSGMVAGASGGIEGIGGCALSVRLAWAVSTSSGCEVIMGRGSRPIFARWRSTAAMVAVVIISSVGPIGEMSVQRVGEGGGRAGALFADTRDDGCGALSRRLAIRGRNGGESMSSHSAARYAL